MSALTPCVLEDGSGGPLPCHWNAAEQGNGIGLSYVVNADGTVTYDDLVTEPVAPPVTEPTIVLAEPSYVAEIGEPAPAPLTLATTGMDPSGVLLALTLTLVGIGLRVTALVAKRVRR